MPTGTVRRGLYAIVDVDTLARAERAVVPFAERVLAAGDLFALQLRAKSLDARAMLDLARALSRVCERSGVPFFVNDRPDVAVLSDAIGVHVGTADLSVADVRRFAPELKVGASSHNERDVVDALAAGADYLAFGPIFATRSKVDHAPLTGAEALRVAVARCVAAGCPVVAIGGITLESAPLVCELGATAGALISALVVERERVTANARALHLALGGA